MSQTIALDQITVESRQREDYGDIDAMKASLQRFGQLQPIGLNQEGKLLWGGRRLMAAIALGWTEIKYVIKETATDLDREEIELEENIQRKDLTWEERERAIVKMHRFKMANEPNWTAEKTAEAIGVSRRRVFNAIALTSALEKAKDDPQYADVTKAESSTGAMQRLNRIEDIKKRIEAAAVRELAQTQGMVAKTKAEIIHGDAVAWLDSQVDESLDAIVFNPPYGVDIEDIYVTDKTIYGNDDPITMGNLCRRIVESAAKKLKPNRWMVVFWPTIYLEDLKGIGPSFQGAILETISSTLLRRGWEPDKIEELVGALRFNLKSTFAGWLANSGFKFQKVPAIWCKTGKFMSSLSNPQQMLNLTYETFYFARKGNAQFHEIDHGNVFHHPTVAAADRIHALEMSDELWEDIFKLIAVGGETVVEPCSGSGRASWAAIRRGLNYIGIEINDTNVERSRMLVSEGQQKFGSVTTTAPDSANNAPAVGIQSDNSVFESA